MRARPPAGRTPKTRRLLDPPPPPGVPTVVTARAQRAQIRNLVRATVATLDHVIDNQPTAGPSRGRAAVACRTSIAIPLENFRPYSFPGLRAVEAFVCLSPLARRRRPARRSEYWWSHWHDVALRIVHGWHTRVAPALLAASVASVFAANSWALG
jgi:hypothetical protein